MDSYVDNAKTEKPMFIVFEGLDGSGKTTQIKLLASYLREQMRRVYVTAEPTQSATGGLIRDTLTGNYKRSACELAGLFLADRIAHNVNPVWGIHKFLKEGMDVISDRYYYSSFAYQGTDKNLKWIIESNLSCPEITRPDLCIFLDLDPASCQTRMDSRAVLEIYEGSKALLKQTRDRFYRVFDQLAHQENVQIVDAARPQEAVAADIRRIVRDWMQAG